MPAREDRTLLEKGLFTNAAVEAYFEIHVKEAVV